MYHLYQTPGIVLSLRDIGEADCILSLLTRELGLVRARVKSARLSHSKLRAGIQPFSLGMYSLVRGREFWKLTGASAHTNAYYALRKKAHAQGTLARLNALVERTVYGEERDEELFAHMRDVYRFVLHEPLEAEALRCVERAGALRVLACLGYVPQTPLTRPLLDKPLSREHIGYVQTHERALDDCILEAVEKSHL